MDEGRQGHYNTMFASSPFLDSQGCKGLSDWGISFFHDRQEGGPVPFSRCPPSPASARAVSLAKVMRFLVLFSRTVVLKTSDLAMSLLKAAKVMKNMQETVKDAGKAEQSSLTSATASAQHHWLHWLRRQRKSCSRRRGKLSQLLLALIVPKDQFSDHYLLSHTCRHTYLTDLERICKLASEE